MSLAKRVASVTMPMFFLASSINVCAAIAQQAIQPAAGSSQSGASASRAGARAGGQPAGRATPSAGGSRWVAGQGSFGAARQSDGIWRDGSTLGALPGAAPGTTPGAASAANTSTPPRGLAPGSSVSSPVARRSSPSPAAAHLSNSPSGPRAGNTASRPSPVSTAPGLRHAGTIRQSRLRPSSRGLGAGRIGSAPGLAAGKTLHSPIPESPARSSLRGTLGTGLSRKSAGTPP
jgi:hypothetical protein